MGILLAGPVGVLDLLGAEDTTGPVEDQLGTLLDQLDTLTSKSENLILSFVGTF